MTKDELYEKIRNKALDRVNQELREAIRHTKSNRLIAYLVRSAMPMKVEQGDFGAPSITLIIGVQQYAHTVLLEEYIDEEIRQQAESVALFDEIGKMLKDIRKERER